MPSHYGFYEVPESVAVQDCSEIPVKIAVFLTTCKNLLHVHADGENMEAGKHPVTHMNYGFRSAGTMRNGDNKYLTKKMHRGRVRNHWAR
jgi:hypothetical protein